MDVSITMGATADRIADPMPAVTYGGDHLTATSSMSTSNGNRFVVIVSSAATTGTLQVGQTSAVQAGFSVPGATGTIFYDSGTFTATAIDLAAGGQIEGTFSGLYRPADALGLAPESTADGVVRISVPNQ
jgi:hypothetical protein